MTLLQITNFNIVCASFGGFITLFGLVSYLFKERYYLSEALISLLAGVVFSPNAANFIKPLEYANGSDQNLANITLYFTRLVLDVQLVICGVGLPKKFMYYEWKSLSLLLGPGMCGMWICSSLIIWGLVPNLSFLHALAVGACVTPTDPVLSNSIVKGKFADENIPKDLQNLIIAESGANDGLGYPFLFIALYLIKYVGSGGAGQPGGASLAMSYWFGVTWAYTIIFGTIYGAIVGWLAKELLRFAEKRKLIDRESLLVFAITLALFISGTCGMIGSDDVLASFIAGNVFNMDDWFRTETLDDSLHPPIDMLLNLAVFMWFGAVCPWNMFLRNDIIPIYRLIFIGILILLFRRIPVVYLMHKKIHQIDGPRQLFFAGFFGPIGVSAIFYLFVSLQFLGQVTVDGVVREDAVKLGDVTTIVVWFLTICSIVVHGLSVPLAKLIYRLPRTFSTLIGSNPNGESGGETFNIREQAQKGAIIIRHKLRQRPEHTTTNSPPSPVFRSKGSVMRLTTSRGESGGVTIPSPTSPIGSLGTMPNGGPQETLDDLRPVKCPSSVNVVEDPGGITGEGTEREKH
ncbi:hypothetical protein MMC12_002470 [Toensbergia leucococca]|nr:hypothetical protein [Toensbergia leucococca]